MKTYPSKFNRANIILMVTILMVVIFLMIALNRKQFLPIDDPLSNIKGTVKVIDRHYYNKPFRFALTVPNNHWEYSYSPNVDSTIIDGSHEHAPAKIVQLVCREGNNTIAVIDVVLFLITEETTSDKLAARDLKRIKQDHPESSIVSSVTHAGSIGISAAYHVVELPQTISLPYPVWVTMFIVRDQLAYTMKCQVKRDSYEQLRPDLERLLKNFRFL